MPARVFIGTILNRFDKIALADTTLNAIAGYGFGGGIDLWRQQRFDSVGDRIHARCCGQARWQAKG